VGEGGGSPKKGSLGSGTPAHLSNNRALSGLKLEARKREKKSIRTRKSTVWCIGYSRVCIRLAKPFMCPDGEPFNIRRLESGRYSSA